MDQQQAQQLAMRMMREEPRLWALAGTESQAAGPDFWVVRLFVKATGDPRDVIESESDWEELKQILQRRGDW